MSCFFSGSREGGTGNVEGSRARPNARRGHGWSSVRRRRPAPGRGPLRRRPWNDSRPGSHVGGGSPHINPLCSPFYFFLRRKPQRKTDPSDCIISQPTAPFAAFLHAASKKTKKAPKTQDNNSCVRPLKGRGPTIGLRAECVVWIRPGRRPVSLGAARLRRCL